MQVHRYLLLVMFSIIMHRCISSFLYVVCGLNFDALCNYYMYTLHDCQVIGTFTCMYFVKFYYAIIKIVVLIC